jgi:SAM-dependent methyltransferase
MASKDRWKAAQSYERAFWENAAKNIAAGDRSGLTFYKWRAENLAEMLAKAFPKNTPSFADGCVAEIGSGAVGTVAFFEAKEKYAYDPLCDFYATRPELIEHRSPEVNYVQAQGENLPHADAVVDLVIIENVIDHVQSPEKVMKEIDRIMKPDAVLFLTVNLHPAWGAGLHSLLAALKIDKGHPHTYTLSSIRRFLDQSGFEIRHQEWQSYRECRRADWKSKSTRDRLKAAAGLSEFLYSCVLTKKRVSR